MKIIKIAHANMASELKLEQESLILQNYDLTEFLKRQGLKVIDQLNKDFEESLPDRKNNLFLELTMEIASIASPMISDL